VALRKVRRRASGDDRCQASALVVDVPLLETNILIHAYADVDPELVWRVAREHLPALRERLKEILRT
jgi:hypothetical protein